MKLPAVVAWSIAALWAVMSLTYPFGWDQGIFAWAGGIIVQGGMPYKDAWDLKGPLAYYLYALAEWLFGVHLWSIRLVDAALLGAAALALARAASALTDAVTGRWAALVYVLWYASHSYWHTAQPDGWTGMLLVIALGPLLRSDRAGPVVLAAAGVTVGAITLFKPIYAVFLALPFLHVALAPSAGRVTGSSVVLGAWLLPIVIAASWFSFRGALDDLIAVHVRDAATYAGLSPESRFRGVLDYFLSSRVMAVALPVVAYGGFVLWRSARQAAAVVLGVWIAIGVGGVLLQNRFFAYHWLPMLPAATLLGAVGLRDAAIRARPLAYVLGGAILLHCLAPILPEQVRFLSWTLGRIDREAYYRAYGEAADDMRTVWWLREEARPGSVYVFGWNTGVVWLSGRPTISRFGFSMPLLVPEGDGRARYRDELLRALRTMPPQYIIDGVQSERILGRVLTVADFPAFADLLDSTYRPIARFGRITVHERDGSPE
jgi:hypothetical protein